MGRERQWDGVRARSKRGIEIDFTYKGIRCRERLKLTATTKNLERAFQHRCAILDAIANGTFNYAITFPDSPRRFLFSERAKEGYPLESYLTTWLEKQKSCLKASTYDDYRKIVENTLIPAFGQTQLLDLKRSQVKDWCAKQKAGNKRLANIQSVLRKALEDLKDEDDDYVNPLSDWKYEKNLLKSVQHDEDELDESDVYDSQEQAKLIAGCRDPQIANFFQVAFWTGLRTSEQIAVTWPDINLVKGTMRINKAKTEVSEEIEGVKTKGSRRVVKLLPMAIEALKAQAAFTRLANKEVFLNPRTNEPWPGDQALRHAWGHAIADVGLRYLNPYKTRHTYASMMLTAGENLGWIASQMGHTDLTMLSRRYAHWIKMAAPDAGQKAHLMFGTTKKVVTD